MSDHPGIELRVRVRVRVGVRVRVRVKVTCRHCNLGPPSLQCLGDLYIDLCHEGQGQGER